MNFKNLLLDLVFPRHCLGCKVELTSKQASLICEACFGKIILNSALRCHICGLRNNLGACYKCRSKTQINSLHAIGFYHDPILREMIHCFKYNSIESLKKPLTELMISYITKNQLNDYFKNCILVPIPLTLRRRIRRGFNQSEILAKLLSQSLNCPVINLLKRQKFILPQVNISDWQKRKENISGAFAINSNAFKLSPHPDFSGRGSPTLWAAPYPLFTRYRKPDTMGGKKVVLVDDVSTSGATLEEAARTLKEAGVKEIYGLVIAKG